MKYLRLSAWLLCAALLCGSLAACKDKKDESPEPLYTPETVEGIDPSLTEDYTADASITERISTLSKSFADLQESPASDFQTTEVDGGVRITDYLGAGGDVRIPASIGGKTVTGIANAAFADKTAVKRLYIPDSVKTVVTGILKGCTSLTALRTPIVGDGGSHAYLGYFFGSESHMDNARDVPATLVYLELGAPVCELADYALFDCNDLEYISMPSELTRLGSYALYNCSRLLALDVSHLAALGEGALDSCTKLTRLDFSDALQSISQGALRNCRELRRMTLPFIGGSKSENTYLAYLFGASDPTFAKGYYPQYFTELALLPMCTEIGDYALYECPSLQRIALPETLQTIGVRAFNRCVRLQNLRLPAALTTVRENAFFGCLSLAELTTAPESNLTAVGVNAFYGCENLTKVQLPASLKALSASAFADCFSLTEIDLGGVITVEKNAFHRCSKLQTVIAQPNITFAQGNQAAETCVGGR